MSVNNIKRNLNQAENHDNNINYMLVVEYADSLACAVSCLHNEGIFHRDLHSGNILHWNWYARRLYTRCLDGELDNRPTIYQVVDWLKAIATKTDVKAEILQLSSKQELNLSNAEVLLSTSNSELQGELSQLIQNFNKISTSEINTTSISN
ncbi:kinase-like domain-containing protein [Rhizophagus irregularis DAOM 181602=DAOM 197198]|nr:kinase-like domain-containing protein [Rhizophagus irregularis DAOM 181602=DAOM 197198]